MRFSGGLEDAEHRDPQRPCGAFGGVKQTMPDVSPWELNVDCGICGAQDSFEQFSVNGRRIGACADCGTVRLLDRIRPDRLELLYATYYSEASIDPKVLNAQLRNPTFASRARRLESVLPADRRRLFEAGAGDGNFLAFLKRRGWQAAGSEYSEHSVALVKRRHGIDLVQGDIIGADLPESCCDAFAAYHVLEHVYQPREFVRAARRLIAPGGVMHLQVPNFSAWLSRMTGSLSAMIVFPQHVYFYSPASLAALLRREGLEPIRISTYDPWHGPGATQTTVENVIRKVLFGRSPWPDQFPAAQAPVGDPVAPHPRWGAKRTAGWLLRGAMRPMSVGLARAESLFGCGAVVDIIARPTS